MCVDYRELKNVKAKYYFPQHFIYQVLGALARKKYLCFLDGFSGYNQIQIDLEDQDKKFFSCPWGSYDYNVLPFGFCNALATF